MNQFQDESGEGLVEAVGQELQPFGSATPVSFQPRNGQWSFRFNHADPTKVSVFVTVDFGPPFSLTAELTSEMNPSQVGSLRDWLNKVSREMS